MLHVHSNGLNAQEIPDAVVVAHQRNFGRSHVELFAGAEELQANRLLEKVGHFQFADQFFVERWRA